ncbi:UNVERIFIED_CONTAM: BOI-related E3 ubiquitin-protein ligase 1 [Sesamum radiatum]|uniref:BOI-related E3 ubiquitin-protein ligase 1 n=1 Tax=Sesamum radiatum TaxID=300843 RepID=A0AAW2T0B1_SESRA
MAVEARHLNLFPSQLIPDGNLLDPSNQVPVGSAYNSQQMRFLGIPFPAALPENQSLYQPVVCDSVQAKTSVNTDSGLTYNIPAPRKRSRDSVHQLYATHNYPAPQKNNCVPQFPSFPGEDVLPQIQQYQLEIDTIISQHTKKIRLELEERQKQQARLLAAAIGGGVMKKLKEKDEQIQRMGKLNLVLQERVKSLYVENQLLRDLAQTNEATANSLRTNLEQVLLHVGGKSESPASWRRTWSRAVAAASTGRVSRRRKRVVVGTMIGGARGVGRGSRACCCCRAGISASATSAGAGPNSSKHAPSVTLP